MKTQKAIQTIDLTKRFGETTAVLDLNLTVEQGELFALLGMNGAGKTTTIKILACLSKPTSGDAILLGDSVLKHPARVKQRINISPQETAVAPNLTVLENLQLIARIYQRSATHTVEQANTMIEKLGLHAVANKRAGKLSGGWQRRLSIAMALISSPQILFLDEPTLGLDVIARRELWGIIRDLKGDVTIILTSHYLEEVEALSDRVAVLADGRLKAVGTVPELISHTSTSNFEDAFITLAGVMQ